MVGVPPHQPARPRAGGHRRTGNAEIETPYVSESPSSSSSSSGSRPVQPSVSLPGQLHRSAPWS
jgi:hypothetical protein